MGRSTQYWLVTEIVLIFYCTLKAIIINLSILKIFIRFILTGICHSDEVSLITIIV